MKVMEAAINQVRLEEIEKLQKERDLYNNQLNYIVCMKDKEQMLKKIESLNRAISLIKSFM